MDLHCVEMLEELESLISDGRKSLMSGRISVDKEELLTLIREIKGILPDELLQADAFYRESKSLRDDADREADNIISQASNEANEIIDKAQSDAEAIIADANSEADAIINDAKNQQAELISEHRITQLATEHGNNIVNQASDRAAEIKRATKSYLSDKLDYVADVLAKTYNEIQNNKSSL